MLEIFLKIRYSSRNILGIFFTSKKNPESFILLMKNKKNLYLAYYIRFLKLTYKWAKRGPLSAVVACACAVLDRLRGAHSRRPKWKCRVNFEFIFLGKY
jgi:hypothetical protein